MNRVYLDHCASSPLKPAARAAMVDALSLTGNPSSTHGDGRAVRRMVEDARESVAALAHVSPARVMFTAGGSEANQTALRGHTGRVVLPSAIEHDSGFPPPTEGADHDPAGRIPVGPDGVVSLDALREMLERRAADGAPPALVSVMLVNNETGVIQPVAAVAEIAHAHGALVHCDAVQAAGRLPLDFAALGCDTLSLSAHKLGGPTGVGALILAEGVEPRPLIHGGGQERRRRAGTENLVGIAGFGAVAANGTEDLADVPRLAALRDSLESAVIGVSDGRVRVAGADGPRVAAVSCLVAPGPSGEKQVMRLDLARISVSAGAACSSGRIKPSHVLEAMGMDAESAASAIRVSLGWTTTEEDVRRFLSAYLPMISAARARAG